jgi:hypothetical protein
MWTDGAGHRRAGFSVLVVEQAQPTEETQIMPPAFWFSMGELTMATIIGLAALYGWLKGRGRK